MIYDYYYSALHDAHVRAICARLGEGYTKNYINGMRYTEMVAHGKEPHTAHFPDIKKVCTGGCDGIVVVIC